MNYYNEIREELINNEVYKKVKDYSKNRSDLDTYYKVGKLLSEAGKHYGEGIIKEYAIKLKTEVSKMYGYRTLFRIRQFYIFFNNKKVSTVSTQLTWSHYVELIALDNVDKINYYIKMIENYNLSVRELRLTIKNNEYERLPVKTRERLLEKKDSRVEDLIKNPILIKNSYNNKNITEYMLHTLILEDIPNFLKELGEGFSFIDSEYKIKLGERYNYIDLLLYNIKYNCYVVVELKVTELKKEHIGQIKLYMNYIDSNIKNIYQDKTIGIVICKKDNMFVMEYCSDKRIFNTIYVLV